MLNKFLRIPKGLFFWVFSGYLLWKIWAVLTSPPTTFNNITWLINYDSGFTKRGLFGSVIRSLFGDSGSLQAIEIIVKIVFLALIASYFALIFRYRKNNFISLALLLSPALIMFLLNDMEMLGRIEQIGILITLSNCILIRHTLRKFHNHRHPSGNNHHQNYTAPLIVAAPVFMLSVLMFAHEGTLLLIAPFNFILTFIFLYSILPKKETVKPLLLTAAAYAPVGLSFLYLLLNKDDTPAHAFEICNNIKSAFPELIKNNCRNLPTILKFHVMPFTEAISSSFQVYASRFSVYMFFACLGFALSFLSYIAIAHVFHFERPQKITPAPLDENPPQIENQNGSFSKVISTIDDPKFTAIIFYFFILPFTCTIPMYVIAVDWGRWLAAINLQFVFVSLVFIKPDFLPLATFPFADKDSYMKAYNKFIFQSFLILVLLMLKLPHWSKVLGNFFSPLADLLK